MLTWLEISKPALQHNIRQFRKLIGPKVLLMPVVKSNAYGHGFLEVAKILNKEKQVNRICVVNLDEANELINGKIKKPIQILSFFEWNEDKIKKAIKNKVIFPIYSLEYAKKLNKLGEKLKIKVKIAIKVDTGASRVGILPKDTIKFIKTIKQLNNLQINDLFSHFASSEEDKAQTDEQYKIFNNLLKEVEKENIKIPVKHIACSAVPVIYSKANLNAMRLGISLYGLHPGFKTKNKVNLKPVLSWYTKVIQIKNIPKGTKVSYGGTCITNRETKIAVLPIGYWDGYDRSLGNKAFVEIKGQKCPILGRICMNLTVVDVTKVKNIRVEDQVALIGGNVTADDLAKWADTINYEIVTRINSQLPRIIK